MDTCLPVGREWRFPDEHDERHGPIVQWIPACRQAGNGGL
jgi:hypothetical protein